ncbi:hypothetical protein [Streptomyces sp. NPDC048202]|uniref:hypothetical protein n=1 Tax=Streptomyces sp. NPDC048202 TaxID=3365514 RepID=UPI003717843F
MSPSDDVLALLDEAWDDEVGFLGKLRAGEFDAEAGAAYVALFARIPPVGETVDSRLVQLIWFAPMFIEWQSERAGGGAELRRISTQVQEAVAEILGMP